MSRPPSAACFFSGGVRSVKLRTEKPGLDLLVDSTRGMCEERCKQTREGPLEVKTWNMKS